MRSIKELFEAIDLKKFGDKCGREFLEGSNGLLERYGLENYSGRYTSIEAEEKLTKFIDEIDDEVNLVNLKTHTKKIIIQKEEEIKQCLKDIVEMKKEIKDKNETIKLMEKSKSFKQFFKKVIKE